MTSPGRAGRCSSPGLARVSLARPLGQSQLVKLRPPSHRAHQSEAALRACWPGLMNNEYDGACRRAEHGGREAEGMTARLRSAARVGSCCGSRGSCPSRGTGGRGSRGARARRGAGCPTRAAGRSRQWSRRRGQARGAQLGNGACQGPSLWS